MKRLSLVLTVAIVAGGFAVMHAQNAGQVQQLFASAQHKETTQGDLKGAIEGYKQVIAQARSNRALAAQALLRMAECYQKLGDPQAREVYASIVRDYADQTAQVAQARARLGTTGAKPQTEMLRKVISDGFQGSVSPDGRFFVYLSVGVNAMVLRDLSTGVDRTLDRGKLLLDPVFSRDSTRLAYAACETPIRTCDVRVMNLTATSPQESRPVFSTDGSAAFTAPIDWSPDGKSIAVYVQRQADRVLQLGIITLADGALHVLKSVAWGGIIRGYFSPDGRDIAFNLRMEEDDGRSDIFLIAADASREVPIVANHGEDFVLGWTPDGTHVLFGTDRSGAVGVWAQRVANRTAQGLPRLVRADIGTDIRAAGITRTGSLYMGQRTGYANIEVATLDLPAGKQAAPPVRPVQRDAASFPIWSPDGQSLAYRAPGRSKETVIVIRAIASGSEIELPLLSKLDAVSGLTWAPDGRSFLTFGRDTKGRYGIFRINAADGSVTSVEFRDPPAVGLEGFSWSPDGRRMYYRNVVLGTIYERDVETDKERVIAAGNGRQGETGDAGPDVTFNRWYGPMSVSPDGRWIATSRATAADRASVLMLIPIAGGDGRDLIRLTQPEIFDPSIAAPLWTPDGRALLAVKQLNSDRRELWLVPIDGAAPRKLDFDANRMKSTTLVPALHPDGRQLAYNVGETRNEIVALENFLSTLKN